MSEDLKYMQVRVPKELHHRAKIEAATSGKPIQEILEKLINLWLDGKIKLEELEKEK